MSLATTTPIQLARPTDVPDLAGVLAHAFRDDPVFAWSIPNPHRRRARLAGVFAAFAELFLPHGETYLTGEGAGAAMWAPAGVDPFEGRPGEEFAQRLGDLLGDDARRCLEVGEIFAQYHPSRPCMHLQLIGVRPHQQGRGLGSRLLHPVLQRCDATGTPAYLEASTIDNRRLYERHGFRTTDEITLPEGGPRVWAMWREPGSA